MDNAKKITANELVACGPVVCLMFKQMYSDGLERENLERLAQSHGWARRALEALDKEATDGNS